MKGFNFKANGKIIISNSVLLSLMLNVDIQFSKGMLVQVDLLWINLVKPSKSEDLSIASDYLFNKKQKQKKKKN